MSTETAAPLHPYFLGQAQHVLEARFGAERAATADPMPLARWAEANHAADHHRRHGVIVDAHGVLHLRVTHTSGPAGGWYAVEALSDQGRAAMDGHTDWVADMAQGSLQRLLREEEGPWAPAPSARPTSSTRCSAGSAAGFCPRRWRWSVPRLSLGGRTAAPRPDPHAASPAPGHSNCPGAGLRHSTTHPRQEPTVTELLFDLFDQPPPTPPSTGFRLLLAGAGRADIVRADDGALVALLQRRTSAHDLYDAPSQHGQEVVVGHCEWVITDVAGNRWPGRSWNLRRQAFSAAVAALSAQEAAA